jgi:hypothetical protein
VTVASGTLRATAERTHSAPAPARKPHPRPARPAGGVGQLLWLQAAAGNAAVSKMINAKKTEAPPPNAQPAMAVQRDAGSCPAPPVAPPGTTADQDPKFQQVKKDVARKGKTAKAHPNAQHEVGEAQAAAEPPADDREAQAKAAHTAEMAQAKPAGFDKAAFIAAVTEAIAAQRPQTNEEATEFASSGKAGEIKNQVSGMVTEGKDKSGKEIADSSKKAPDPGAAVEKPVTPMTPPKPAPDLKPPDGKKAIPDKAPAEQTELGSTKCELNEKMAGAGVTETQLKNSNEPELMGAADAKGKAEEHAATAPAQMRADEQAQLTSNVAGAQAAGAAGVTGMVGDNARAIGRAGSNKNAAKSRDERERARISGEIKRIFDTTKTEVDGILGGIDAKVDTLFTAGEAKARAVFEADHQRRMREYEDAQDLVTWIADKFRPTRPEVLQIFTDAAKTYEREMQKVISNIADVIGAELDKATARIQLGRDQVARFVAEQPRELQNIAQEAAGEMGDQFESLDASVTEKSSALAEDLASKYAEARAGVDARVQELQAEHRSWRDQAVDAVEGAIDTITKLKDMLLGVLARAAGAIDKIIADPIGFLGNLVTAVKNGVMAFGANIATHLQAGLKAWLLGSLSSAGIEIPEEFDVKGILKMVLSILGLTWPAIRARIVRFIPEPVMARLEQMVEVVQILVTEGVPGLWRWIVEKLGDLKEMVLGQIKEFVVSKIIQAGIVWIISMLNPAAAFIKACQAIYNIVMFFVNQAAQIKEFVDAVLDGIDSIASGGGGAVSALIEGALAKALPMVIGFMASLLGLGGISEKIRGILQKVQEPVGKVIDKVIGTIVKIGKSLFRRLTGRGRQGQANDPDAVKAKVRNDLTGKVFANQAEAEATLRALYTQYQPEGLKRLELVPPEKEGDPPRVLASASPYTQITLGKRNPGEVTVPRLLYDFKFTTSKTSMYVSYDNGKRFGVLTNSAGKHAEQNLPTKVPELLQQINRERARGTINTPPGQPVPVLIEMNRLPCDTCINNLVLPAFAGTNGQLQVSIAASSVWTNRSLNPIEHTTPEQLLRLMDAGIKIDALYIWEQIERQVAASGAQEVVWGGHVYDVGVFRMRAREQAREIGGVEAVIAFAESIRDHREAEKLRKVKVGQ